ncbi:MAG: SHOCT domain-containing protein [Candidatus Limnocylindrales bacterium]|jgi:hypothetical protein|nr:SHOCT domain-containing protein [Candidatus Limnocylindrales bacterium]
MWLTLDDLQCSECGAFVHPLLESCPDCGTAHASRRDEAAAGPIGAVRLADAPETERMARNLTMRYTMKINVFGGSVAGATLGGAVGYLAEALPYRMVGDGVPITDQADLALRDGALVAQVRPSRVLLAEIPLPSILAAAPGHGSVVLYYAPGPNAPVAGPSGGATNGAGPLRLTVANRRGLFVARARDAHFEDFARWLGVLTAAAAEQRWTEIGLPSYLVELGLATPGAAVPSVAVGASASAGPATVPAVTSSSAIATSLQELERLRAAGLVAEDEYSAKRREILARL